MLAFAVSAVVAVVLSVKVADSRVISTSGPLGDGGDEITICAQARQGQAVTTATIRLRSAKPVRIDSFAAVEAKGLHFLGSAVVPLGHGGSVGLLYGYPPISGAPATWQWNHRHAVEGAVIGPHTQALAIGLARQGKAMGDVKGFWITYHSASARYVLRTHTEVQLVAHCQ